MNSDAISQGTSTGRLQAARDRLLEQRSDYNAAVTSFIWPEMGANFNWAVDWFDEVARDNHTRALIVVNDDDTRTERTFAELAQRSDQLAHWLAAAGVKRGESVLLMLGNQVELWESMLAIMKLGAVAVPTTTAVGTKDLTDRVARAAVRHVIAAAADTTKFDDVAGSYTRIAVGAATEGWRDYSGAFAEPARRVAHPGTAPEDRLLLYFTSGTTSRPKLVEHTQVSYPVGHLSTMYWLGLQPGDVHLAISSPGWAKHAWSCLFAPWLAEATVLIYNYTRFDAEAMLHKLQTEAVTTFCAPPTVWRMLIQADMGERPSALREVVSAGEPINPEVIEQVQHRWGLTIRDGYGQTEMTAVVANPPGIHLKPGSMGRPLPGCPIVLLDPVTGAPGEEGEICIDLSEGPINIMTGYVGDAHRTEESAYESFYRTGDVARRDHDGYITYIGRADDVFKASDYKISPFELESVLIEHPAVAEAAVVPAPDATRLAVPKAYVALAPGYQETEATALDILKYAREHLAPFQRVRRLEFFDLPKTISGKIRRVELRQREERAADGTEQINDWRDDTIRTEQ
ncbi:AMP-binding protein [Microbacterium sp. 22303]|uniref:AMP-binding protein n=1 Tax=Microbacterium sp. 22303 TaxID=3453905 RepID=UPI003F86A20B